MRIFKIIGCCLLAILIIGAIYLSYCVYLICAMPLLLADDYATIYVEKNDVVDAEIMRNPVEKFCNLTSLDTHMREEVAEYMEKNQLKLKEGEHEFRIYYREGTCRRLTRGGEWINALVEGEWINEKKISGFEFEKIE